MSMPASFSKQSNDITNQVLSLDETVNKRSSNKDNKASQEEAPDKVVDDLSIDEIPSECWYEVNGRRR